MYQKVHLLLCLMFILSSCSNDKLGTSKVKLFFNWPKSKSSGMASYESRAFQASDVVYMVVSWKSTSGQQRSVSVFSNFQSQVSFTIPNGEIDLAAYFFVNNVTDSAEITQNYMMYFDSNHYKLSGAEVNVTFNLRSMGNSPLKTAGVLTLKNEAGTVVTDQKIGIKPATWPSPPKYLFLTTTTSEGKFTLDKLAREIEYTVDVLNESSQVIKSVNFKASNASSFAQDVQYIVTPEYCATLSTEANCGGVTGCIWMSNSCQAQFQINCSLAQTDCQKNSACFWNATSNSCEKTMSVNCTIKSEAQCTGACMWKNGVCINSSMSNCSSITSSSACVSPCFWTGTNCRNLMRQNCAGSSGEAVCRAQTACYWDGSICKGSMSTDCAGYSSNEATCKSQTACFWDGSSCKNKMSVNCPSYSAEATCRAQTACYWSGTSCQNQASTNCSLLAQNVCNTPCYWTGTACRNQTSTNCSLLSQSNCNTPCYWSGTACQNQASTNCSLLAQNVCNTPCYWSGTACQNQASTNCSLLAQNVCNTPCYWNGTACQNQASTNCSLLAQNICNTPCYWNGTACQNQASTNCSLLAQNVCNTPCYWNGTACQNQASTNCSLLAQNVCNTPCYWNGTSCQTTISINCASYGQTDCQNQQACSWISNACVNSMSVNCSTYTAQGENTCNAQNVCTWNSTTNACINSGTVDCASYDGASCITNSSCFWDSSANLCKNATTVDCQQYTSQNEAACEANSVCYWDSSVTPNDCKRVMANCMALTTETDCNSHSTECQWVSSACGHKYLSGGGSGGSPSLDPISNGSMAEGGTMSTIDANDGGNDQDSDGDNLTYSCYFDTEVNSSVAENSTNACTLFGNAGLDFNSTTGVLNWSSKVGYANIYEFKIKADDGNGNSDSKIFTITVTSVINGSWGDLGSDASSEAIVGSQIGLDATEKPYIAYKKFSDSKIEVRKYDSSVWSTIGTLPDTIMGTPTIFLEGSTPYVAYVDTATSKVKVFTWTGATWSDAAFAGIDAVTTTTDTVSPALWAGCSGRVIVAYRDASTKKIVVLQYLGAWGVLSNATASFVEADPWSPAMAVNACEPYIAYVKEASPYKLRVIKYSGGWTTIGDDLSNGRAYGPKIIWDSDNNKPMVVYNDGGYSNYLAGKIYVSGSTWGEIGYEAGNPVIYMGNVVTGGASIAYQSAKGLFLAFENATSGNSPFPSKLTVMRFDAGVWGTIGGAGLGSGEIDSPSITVKSDGSPIVVYKDSTISDKARVIWATITP